MRKYNKIIKEEKIDSVVNAPKDEIDRLQSINDTILKGGATLVNLAYGPNGLPLQVKIGERTYTAGLKIKDKDFWIVYDGDILTVKDGKYVHHVKDGKIAHLSGVPDANLSNAYKQYLEYFGIEDTENLYDSLDQAQTILQNLVTSGAVGNDLVKFNKLLLYYYPSDETKRLTGKDGKPFSQPIDKEEISSKYNTVSLDRYGLRGSVFIPKGGKLNLVSGKLQVSSEGCKTTLKDYFISALDYDSTQEETLSSPQRNDYRDTIRICKGKGFYDGTSFTKAELGLQITSSKDPLNRKSGLMNSLFGQRKSLSFSDIETKLNKVDKYRLDLHETIKNKEVMLNKVIKKTLIETKENKKRLLQESKIVKTRFTMLMESSPLKTKKQVDDLYVNILAEMIYLHNQGFDNKLIAESVQGVFGVLSNLFGKSGGAIVDTFKEKGVNWILTKLGLEDNSYFKNFLITTLGNTNITDVPKLFTDCSFLTKKIAESIPEAYLRKLEYEKGLGGGISDVIRNTLYDVVRNSDFAQKLEASLAGLVCPVVSKMTSKFENKLSGMKSNLISPKNMKSSLVSLPFS